MNTKISILILLIYFAGMSEKSYSQEKLKFYDLTKAESNVINDKGTETPFTGKYTNYMEKGTYVCKKCGAALYYSTDKFVSDCGWPSFDNEIKGAVIRIPDPDGIRTEIECANCGAHLGHVFTGEHLTAKNVRHCVNSVSLQFVPAQLESGRYGTAIFAGGCFWGVEYYLHKANGVKSVISGYTGGHVDHPTYEQVCSGKTGHYEAVEVVFDPAKTNYETIARLFFEIHDPTEWNHQGPDFGEQYRSAVFYRNEQQKEITEKLVKLLKEKGLKVVTEVKKASAFWPAEAYHQEYYEHKGTLPYCHGYVKRF